MDNRPIGVFDSGLGGLTAVRELKKLLPNESIVYLGDTARVPYGSRSRETLEAYIKQDINFLKSKDVKMIVAACGTVSSIITDEFAKSIGVPYIGVIEPSAKYACEKTKKKDIAVIGTKTSINSEAYKKAIKAIDSDIKVVSQACPLLVDLVENGLIQRDNQITVLTTKMYLEDVLAQGPDTLILGCTHFPIIYDIIKDIVGESVEIVDSGKQVARYTLDFLNKNSLTSQNNCPTYDFNVTDRVAEFESVAQIFLGEKMYGVVNLVDIGIKG